MPFADGQPYREKTQNYLDDMQTVGLAPHVAMTVTLSATLTVINKV